MERKAWRESRKAVVSILSEFISASMVRIAKSGREIFHQLRNLLILDVVGSEKCPNGVHRGRNFLSPDGATTTTVIIAATWRINCCQAGLVCVEFRLVSARLDLFCAGLGLVCAEAGLFLPGWIWFSIAFRLLLNPMVCEKLVQPLSSSAQKLISTPMD